MITMKNVPRGTNISISRYQAINRLAEIRGSYRLFGSYEARRKYALVTLEELRQIEDAMPEHEQWFNGRSESELTAEMRVGEHLAVTRVLLGFVP